MFRSPTARCPQRRPAGARDERTPSYQGSKSNRHYRYGTVTSKGFPCSTAWIHACPLSISIANVRLGV